MIFNPKRFNRYDKPIDVLESWNRSKLNSYITSLEYRLKILKSEVGEIEFLDEDEKYNPDWFETPENWTEKDILNHISYLQEQIKEYEHKKYLDWQLHMKKYDEKL